MHEAKIALLNFEVQRKIEKEEEQEKKREKEED
jgi:hypothetical protein